MLPRLQTMENHNLAHRLKLSIQQLDEIQLHSETAQKQYLYITIYREGYEEYTRWILQIPGKDEHICEPHLGHAFIAFLKKMWHSRDVAAKIGNSYDVTSDK